MKQCLSCKTILSSEWGKKPRAQYCSVQCQQDLVHTNWIFRWKSGLEDGRSGLVKVSSHIRRYLFEKYNNQCVRCGWSQVNPKSGKIPLEINHINGDWKDNSESNLELVCPNCHSLEPTHKALNKGNGRYTTAGVVNPGNNKRK